MRIPTAISNGDLTVEVVLKNAANVYLVDSSNFSKRKNGRRFKYYGGTTKRTL